MFFLTCTFRSSRQFDPNHENDPSNILANLSYAGGGCKNSSAHDNNEMCQDFNKDPKDVCETTTR